MEPYLADLQNPESSSLAATHYKNRYIQEHHCYTCHTDYGMFGTLQAKMDGLGHVVRNITGRYSLPLKIAHPYPSARCLACHGESQKFLRSEGHPKEDLPKLLSGETSCIDCHGPAHPPLARRGVAMTERARIPFLLRLSMARRRWGRCSRWRSSSTPAPTRWCSSCSWPSRCCSLPSLCSPCRSSRTSGGKGCCSDECAGLIRPRPAAPRGRHRPAQERRAARGALSVSDCRDVPREAGDGHGGHAPFAGWRRSAPPATATPRST